jgi:CheY-like chemotaxis protein
MLHGHSDFWHCHFAPGVAVAIEIIEKQHIDLVTADLNMPGQSGFDLLERYQDNERFRGLPFLILTGDLEHSAVPLCRASTTTPVLGSAPKKQICNVAAEIAAPMVGIMGQRFLSCGRLKNKVMTARNVPLIAR